MFHSPNQENQKCFIPAIHIHPLCWTPEGKGPIDGPEMNTVIFLENGGYDLFFTVA